MMPEHPAENLIIAIRNASRVLLLSACVLGVAACGGDSSDASDQGDADAEHFLSDQQKALERSKAAAEAMEDAAAERARQTDDARND